MHGPIRLAMRRQPLLRENYEARHYAEKVRKSLKVMISVSDLSEIFLPIPGNCISANDFTRSAMVY